MRISLFWATVTALLLIPACTQATPVASPHSSPTLAPSPTKQPTSTAQPPSSTPTATSTPTSTPTPTVTPTTTPKPSPTPTTQPTPTPQPQVYVIFQQIDVYESPDQASRIGYIIPGKRFVILAQQLGWVHIRTVPTSEGAISSELWIQASETAYYREGEVPVCEAPHFSGRTPDRKTGKVVYAHGPEQKVFPDRPYAMRWIDIGNGYWVSIRDARVTAVDIQNQIITFQLSGGVIIQRKVSYNTLVIMTPHDRTRAIPSEEMYQRGGNICDFEMGDFVSILHPNESESASPNPDLTFLWGAVFVQ